MSFELHMSRSTNPNASAFREKFIDRSITANLSKSGVCTKLRQGYGTDSHSRTRLLLRFGDDGESSSDLALLKWLLVS